MKMKMKMTRGQDKKRRQHENAVQMSRIAMKHSTKAKGYDSEVEDLLRSIMATQNHQIQTMKTWLKEHASDGVVCSPPKISSALGVAGNGIGVGMCMGDGQLGVGGRELRLARNGQ